MNAGEIERIARIVYDDDDRRMGYQETWERWGDLPAPRREPYLELAATIAHAIAPAAPPAPSAVVFRPETVVIHPKARSDEGPFVLHLFERDADADDWHTEHGGWIQIVSGGIEWHPARPAGEEAGS